MDFSLSFWDVLLLTVGSIQATLMAYLRHPRWKALMVSLPLPFSLASLSMGRPVDMTNVMGFMLFLAYAHGVRILYYRCRIPIVIAIFLSVLGYTVGGMVLARLLPSTAMAFWIGLVVAMVVSFAMYRFFHVGEEPGHRTALPVWIKAPVIAGIILFMIYTKQYLLGFMTTFPLVGLVGAYEARHSLGTMCRQIPVMIMAVMPMLGVMHVSQVGLLQWCVPFQAVIGISLGLGWVVFLLILIPIERSLWQQHYRVE